MAWEDDWDRDPFEDLHKEFRKSMRKMERLFRRILEVPMSEFSSNIYITPLLDIKDEGDKYVIEVDLPGVDKKDIDLEVRDRYLIISAKRKSEVNEKKEGYIRSERSFIGYRRELRLPPDADENNIKAKYDNGVLRIEIGKIKGSNTNKINIE